MREVFINIDNVIHVTVFTKERVIHFNIGDKGYHFPKSQLVL